MDLQTMSMAFIAGYRNAINLCLAYAEAPAENAKDARTIN